MRAAEMGSDEDLELLSPSDETSSPVQERKLKRLKKVKAVVENPSQFEALDFDISKGQAFEDPKSGSGFDGSEDENELSSGFDELRVEENGLGSVAKRTLDFDSLNEQVDGEGEDPSQELEIRDSERKEPEKKRHSFDELESKEKKKKKRVKGVSDEEMPMLPERRTAKERREHLAQLRAESQRLLRDTRDAAFKPAPLVQKPISSILEKIRRRKLEVSKKTHFFVDDHDGNSCNDMVELELKDVANEERGNERPIEVESEKATSNHGISDTLCADEIKNVVNVSSHKNLLPQIAVGEEEPKKTFRAPVNDTQDLFSDSQTSDTKHELAEETPTSPLEEVLAPSLLALNLKLDSAPPDDMSSEEEDNDKENIDPQPQESVDLSPTPSGDPVKAFVDEEAEEEDDSDNDLVRFQDDDNEDEDCEDLEELRDMIATGYEEKQSDIERRMELHQKLLDQQDAAKTEHFLRKWGPKQRETTLLDEEGFEEDDEYDEEEDFLETTEDFPPVNLRMHINKIKEMIPQMFTDKDDMYISSDDEEAEKKLVEQCLSEKAQVELLPPIEDAKSKELFGYIKKVNDMPDTRRKAKTSSFSNMLFMGKNGNASSKSSFIGRGSNCSIPSSCKNGSGVLRSFVFEREDSNSKSTVSMAENSSDVIQKENRPTKTASAKFSNSQIKSSAPPRKNETETTSRAQLLEILRRSSLHATHCTRNSIVGHTESIFAAFKLEKKSTGHKANVSVKTL
ncbi:DNA ligase 1-like isoform X2 [Durio zibethinus]|uniref:DNA ligase 1-like isoform X2 n=1 Tax=Durio zibethinus TaxID=66656 RepID=A0A6P6B788_DURZI|nr:DNA ligase 1-like isoform X2 [Durio zibethinus]